MPTAAEMSELPPVQAPDRATLTIKQILAQLDGVFPMDQAVIDG